jgi:hypothetical protein
MKRITYLFVIFVCILWAVPVFPSDDSAKPFGFEIGKTVYKDALALLDGKQWPYEEYEKKHFKKVDKDSPQRGKKTFVLITPKDLEGVRNMMLFFNLSDSTLDCLIVVLDPKFGNVVEPQLNSKYDLVKKSDEKEDLASSYPYVLWQKGSVYIELQKPSKNRLRLVYVEKILHENYKDFLKKSYEPFRKKLAKPPWMDQL